VRQEIPALYGAAVRLFGTFSAARAAAGVAQKPAATAKKKSAK
jgi:hypothetical protein